jgi:hypothetical protein
VSCEDYCIFENLSAELEETEFYTQLFASFKGEISLQNVYD